MIAAKKFGRDLGWPSPAPGRGGSSSAPTPQRLRAVATAIGSRARLRAARSKPASRRGLREVHRGRTGPAPDHRHPVAHAKDRESLKSLNSFRAGPAIDQTVALGVDVTKIIRLSEHPRDRVCAE